MAIRQEEIMRKLYYIYDPKTGCYRRSYPTFLSRMVSFLRSASVLVAAFLLGGACVLAGLYYTGRPYRILDDAVYDSIQSLEVQVASARKAVDILTERDENLYRVILQTGDRTHAILHGNEIPRGLSGKGDIARRLAAVDSSLFRLKGMLYESSYSYDEIARSILDSNDRRSHVPSIIPLAGFDMRNISSGFGYRSDPFTGEGKMHQGIDFPAPTGTPVRATAAGVVKAAGWSNGYGYSVSIDHGFGYVTEYAHLSSISANVGDMVKRGDDVGTVGSTGRSTGSHLHYEVKIGGKNVNPVHFMSSDVDEKEYYDLLRVAADRGATMD